ncbi:MAG TPA: OsmC family protein [Cyclobacteriaceae bacterium]|nr:OsmC family protein [Cyclobacteriaceae bacterium]
MNISASLKNSAGSNVVTVATNESQKIINIPAKTEGQGSSVNGGELLFLALATCFCNDVYREAAKRKMQIESVEVKVSGNFGKEGEPGSNIVYEATVRSTSSDDEIEDLIKYVDTVAEIHNTLRLGTEVKLKVA